MCRSDSVSNVRSGHTALPASPHHTKVLGDPHLPRQPHDSPCLSASETLSMVIAYDTRLNGWTPAFANPPLACHEFTSTLAPDAALLLGIPIKARIRQGCNGTGTLRRAANHVIDGGKEWGVTAHPFSSEAYSCLPKSSRTNHVRLYQRRHCREGLCPPPNLALQPRNLP